MKKDCYIKYLIKKEKGEEDKELKILENLMKTKIILEHKDSSTKNLLEEIVEAQKYIFELESYIYNLLLKENK